MLRPLETLDHATATGLQLAGRLSDLADLAGAGMVPAYVGRRMTAKLEKLEAEIGYLILLRDLANAIDPDGRMARKPLSRAIKAALLRADRVSGEPREYRLKLARRLLDAGFKVESPGHICRML